MNTYQIIYEVREYNRKELFKELRRRANDWVADAYAHLGWAPSIRFRYAVIENDGDYLVKPESNVVGTFEDNAVVESIVIDDMVTIYTSKYKRETK
ncbi:MAG: hypothetical protein IJO06_13360 [Thermoguttaceae bacterium]|nr:hypothetical protein [Thermoguttaceae bacterium]